MTFAPWSTCIALGTDIVPSTKSRSRHLSPKTSGPTGAEADTEDDAADTTADGAYAAYAVVTIFDETDGSKTPWWIESAFERP